MTHTEAPRTIRDLCDRRQAAWNAVQSLETGLIAAPGNPALLRAIDDKRSEVADLSRRIRHALRRVASK